MCVAGFHWASSYRGCPAFALASYPAGNAHERRRSMATTGTKAVIAAHLANTGIAITKYIAWLLTGSSAMLAEGVHSVADAGNQGLLLLGGRRAKRRATADHQFGYGRVRYLYAFIVSIVLFSLGGLFALYEAYHKWAEPHPINSWQWESLDSL